MAMVDLPHAVIVAGPTASGKSALAAAIAMRLDGVVVNADSMQVYRELRILTARPDAAEEASVPHALYGVRPATEPGSVAWWRDAALAEMAQARRAGMLPVLCGGTGLYFAALIDGLAEIPFIPAAARGEARAMLAQSGAAALHAALARVDPVTATRLHPADGQRLARAWEVWRATGRGISSWQADATAPAPWRFTAVVLDPPRDQLRVAIGLRLDAMLRQGALAEVAGLLALRLDPALPAMRACGVPELSAHLRGEVDLATAAMRTAVVTGQYTKRQATWFRRRRLADPARTHMIHARFAGLQQFSVSQAGDFFSFIQSSS
jgi:tRNA dimethylallyltransferase